MNMVARPIVPAKEEEFLEHTSLDQPGQRSKTGFLKGGKKEVLCTSLMSILK